MMLAHAKSSVSPSVARPRTLAARLLATRAQTRALAAPLSAEDACVQSMPDASPTKWHLAHTSWFFETFVLGEYLRGYTAFDPAYRVLFNSYYNAVGDKHPRPQRGLLTRPSLADVLAYRQHVDRGLERLFALPEVPAAARDLLELGLQHEQQHQELILTDIKHAFALNPLQPAYAAAWPLVAVSPQRARWVRFEGGIQRIGFAGEGPDAFSFDNETPAHDVLLRPFEIASHPVTHGDWLAFIEDGGYRRPELWLSLGWDAVQAQGWEAPAYWNRVADAPGGRSGDNWTTYTLRGVVPIDLNTPIVHVSYFEADAYARWADARLPTEAEWEVASRAAAGDRNFVETAALHPLPQARKLEPGALAQMFGDVWEWTATSYAPYPGFRPAAGAVGEYNGKFMCNQYVLRGGSCATPASHIRASYRNFFPPDARWQFSGLRLARDVD
jgi:ergothioneine biosynthesis protein EgtB